MSLLEQKKDFSKRGAFDELYTPNEAVEMILPYIPKEVKTIWECTAIKESKIVKVLRDAGYNVITTIFPTLGKWYLTTAERYKK